MQSVRWKKRTIALIYHLIIFAVAITGVKTNEPWPVWIGIFDLLTFRILPVVHFIQSKLITTIQCPHCHKPISLTDHWGCSCGYISQTNRHVFLPCTNCGKVFTFIQCPSCGMGILT